MTELHSPRRQMFARLVLFGIMIYVFLAAVELFGMSSKMAGRDAAESLFRGLANPFAGLAVGILATALVQSSSLTTSTVVAAVGTGAMVGMGELKLEYAVPIVMGANIGTSVTNTLVSLGHVTEGAAFRRAFAGATMHDFFNLLTVAILFPIELATGFLRKSAEWLVSVLPLHAGSGGAFHSPVKAAVKWLAEWVPWSLEHVLHLHSGKLMAALMAAIALGSLLVALVMINKNMRVLIADRVEQWLNRVLERSGLLGLAIGAMTTAIVQSSSITTSLLVPLFGAGVLRLEAGFPITVGANIGTTVTALMAASVTGTAGLTIALVHLLFNIAGTLLFLPFRVMRRIPIRLAEALAALAMRNRVWVVVYIIGVFFLLPILGILIWK